MQYSGYQGFGSGQNRQKFPVFIMQSKLYSLVEEDKSNGEKLSKVREMGNKGQRSEKAPLEMRLSKT
jgi:hypothetical protein